MPRALSACTGDVIAKAAKADISVYCLQRGARARYKREARKIRATCTIARSHNGSHSPNRYSVIQLHTEACVKARERALALFGDDEAANVYTRKSGR